MPLYDGFEKSILKKEEGTGLSYKKIFFLLGVIILNSCAHSAEKKLVAGRQIGVIMDYSNFDVQGPRANAPFIVTGEFIEMNDEWVVLDKKDVGDAVPGEYWLPRRHVKTMWFYHDDPNKPKK